MCHIFWIGQKDKELVLGLHFLRWCSCRLHYCCSTTDTGFGNQCKVLQLNGWTTVQNRLLQSYSLNFRFIYCTMRFHFERDLFTPRHNLAWNKMSYFKLDYDHISDNREANKSIRNFPMQVVLSKELGETPGFSHKCLGGWLSIGKRNTCLLLYCGTKCNFKWAHSLETDKEHATLHHALEKKTSVWLRSLISVIGVSVLRTWCGCSHISVEFGASQTLQCSCKPRCKCPFNYQLKKLIPENCRVPSSSSYSPEIIIMKKKCIAQIIVSCCCLCWDADQSFSPE